MVAIPATQARQRWAQTLDEAHRAPVTITEHGRESVMVIDFEVAKRALQALEDAEDAATAAEVHAAVVRGDEEIVSLEEVADELGIVLG
ncbi:type II toxin-antitoxin system prevent-host-death family antitoxin [Diaminobutyricibacter sp. McL0618]|uniref:type II toxin-antitoxin system prevent-host-death family antitoxin n=1 Tax=Leifsonia sp. McL0618 TaxID=3415677 RepID=UPI003CF7E87D